MRDGSFDNMTTNQLKEEYISCWFGQMIYGAKTLERRNAIAEEIERRESQKKEVLYESKSKRCKA